MRKCEICGKEVQNNEIYLTISQAVCLECKEKYDQNGKIVETVNIAPDKKYKIYCGLPSYNGENPVGQIFQILNQGPQFHIHLSPFKFSILTYAFNFLWTDALNMRKAFGFTHFLMIHSDVIPALNQNWLETLVNEMEENDADVMSVVVPIKTNDGLTSTGIQFGAPFHPWAVKRYTMKEIFDLPETFTHPQLVVNTGMMLVDLRKPWVEEIFFHIKNSVIKQEDGTFEPLFFPEDWNFSMDAKALGAKVFATRKVKVEHVGPHGYSNDHVWGTQMTDSAFLNTKPMAE